MEMKSENGQCLFVQKDNTVVFKIIGHLRFNTSSGLAAKVEALQNMENINEILIDMSETLFVDSTVLGLIAQLQKYLQKNSVMPIIFYKTEAIYNTLRHLGFHKMFILSKKDNNEQSSMQLDNLSTSTASDTPEILRKRIQTAHELLCEMNEKNKIEFGGVIDSFVNKN